MMMPSHCRQTPFGQTKGRGGLDSTFEELPVWTTIENCLSRFRVIGLSAGCGIRPQIYLNLIYWDSAPGAPQPKPPNPKTHEAHSSKG